MYQFLSLSNITYTRHFSLFYTITKLLSNNRIAAREKFIQLLVSFFCFNHLYIRICLKMSKASYVAHNTNLTWRLRDKNTKIRLYAHPRRHSIYLLLLYFLLTLIMSRSKNHTRGNLGSARTPIILLTSGMPYIRPNVFMK